jgi:predicted nucleic acid-binding protein
MIFAIQDANILIDLHNTGLLENYFALENDTHTTDLVLQEVRHDVEKYIQRGDLKVKTFTAAELQQLLAFKATQPSSLSLEDCSVFQFAIEKGAILLTGESTLRNCAKRANVEAHGIIWLFDLMLEKQALTLKAAIKAMDKLIQTNPRLPLEECHKRLRKWTAHAGG